MNKKGFTLTEMLTVITIIFIISFLVAPSITGLIKKSEDNEVKLFEDNLFLAAETYIQKYSDSYPEFKNDCAGANCGKAKVSLQELVSEKLVKSTLRDPHYCADTECYSRPIGHCNNDGSNCVVENYMIEVTKNNNGTYSYKLIKDGEVIQDTENPTLSLTTITYIDDNFSGWTLSGGASRTTDTDGKPMIVLNQNNSQATSNYLFTNNQQFYATFDAYATSVVNDSSPDGGVLIGTDYYDANHQPTTDKTSGHSYSNNGWSNSLPLNTWTSMKHDYGQTIYGFAYNTYSFRFDSSYSQPTVKIKNFRFYGNFPNNFYLIKVDAKDNVRIQTTKWENGKQTAEYFKTNGKVVKNNQIKATKNGWYTVYTKDTSGNTKIEQIEITNIS